MNGDFMISLSELKQEIGVIVKEINSIFPSPKMYCVNLVGSTEKKYAGMNNSFVDVRDIDIFIDVTGTPESFCSSLYTKMVGTSFSSYRYIEELQIWTFRKVRRNMCFSFHIVDILTIETIISHHNNPSIYDLSLTTFKLNYPTVYRTWIMEARCIGGNEDLLKRFKLSLKEKHIPKAASEQLKKKAFQYLLYFKELSDESVLGRDIIKSQIMEKLISLCYVENDTYYGTLKYLDRDLKNFTHSREIVSLCNELCMSHANGKKDNLKLVSDIERVITL